MAQKWTIEIDGAAQFGGLRAERVYGKGGMILVRALAWKGSQPRLVLEQHEPGYAEWEKLIEGESRYLATITFDGNDEFAQSPADQWLTHGR